MTSEKRLGILDKIKSSINAHGYHVRIVEGGPLPRFTYTIGLYERFGFEVVFAGAFFTLDEMLAIVKELAQQLVSGASSGSPLEVNGLGSFSLQDVEESWAQRVLLGALDYYGLKQIKSFQIVPDKDHSTIDIPKMRDLWNPTIQPIWRWLETAWEFPVSPKSVAVTNLDALRGNTVTEVMRWETTNWELFAGAGPDVEKSDIRIVPLGTMLGQDATLECVVDLEVGLGLWREKKDLEWHSWGKGEG